MLRNYFIRGKYFKDMTERQLEEAYSHSIDKEIELSLFVSQIKDKEKRLALSYILDSSLDKVSNEELGTKCGIPLVVTRNGKSVRRNFKNELGDFLRENYL